MALLQTKSSGLAGRWGHFALTRLAGLLLSFAMLVVITFLIVPLIPGDPAVAVAGEGASQAQIDGVREELGLSQPLWVQFVSYLGGVLRFDFGHSFANGMDVSSLIASRFPYTAAVGLLAIALVLGVGVPLGLAIAFATRGGRAPWLDRTFDLVTGIFFTIPTYVLATAMIIVFSIGLGWLPSGGTGDPRSLLMPTAALMTGPMCVIARTVRREAASVAREDHVRTARGWRLPRVRVYARYVLPNLLTTTLTLSGLILAGMLGGSIIIETVFAWPGIGQALVTGVLQRDYPVIRALVLVIGLLATMLIILVDMLLALIDPRNLERRDENG